MALAAISLCSSLIIVELLLRSIIPLNARLPAEFRIPHPVLGWVLEPDASYLYHMPEANVTVQYNSDGWRDTEHLVKKPDGTFRILVLGDSFMEAYSVELNDAFHKRVEELASEAFSNIEVINLGVGGYGTLQESLVFRDQGQLYTPDLVLLGFFDMNDLIDNSSELSSILKPTGVTTIARPFLDWTEPGQWALMPGNYDEAQRFYEESQINLEAERRKFTSRLAILSLVRMGMNGIRDLEFLQGTDSKSEPLHNVDQNMAELGVNFCTEPTEYTRAWDITESALARLKADVEAAGGKLIVFSVPALEEVSVDFMNEVTANAPFPEKLCFEDAPGHTRLSLILAKLDIELITLLTEFRTVMREDAIQLFHLSDRHWNAEGHALAAEIVVSELIRRHLIPIPE